MPLDQSYYWWHEENVKVITVPVSADGDNVHSGTYLSSLVTSAACCEGEAGPSSTYHREICADYSTAPSTTHSAPTACIDYFSGTVLDRQGQTQ